MDNSNIYIDKTILLLRNRYKQEKLKSMPLASQITDDELTDIELSDNDVTYDEIGIGSQLVPLQRVPIFQQEDGTEGLFSIKLPVDMEDLDPIRALIKYSSSKRPQVIKTMPGHTISMTFSRAERKNNQDDIRERIREIRTGLQKANQSHVFYDTGEVEAKQVMIPWFDYRGYAMDGNYYCILFLLYVDNQMVIGSFQCMFSVYSTWKTPVIKLLSTITFGKK